MAPPQISELSPNPPKRVKIGRNHYIKKEASATKKKDGKDALLEPYNYLRQNPGKDMKMILLSAFDYWIQTPKEYMGTISKLTETAHRAGLLIDDIQDNTELRRGAPAAHRIYGVPLTLSSAYYASFLMLSDLTKLGKPEMVNICIEEVTNLQYGQGMDVYYRDAFICPTEKEYLQVVDAKTGALLRLAVRLMQASSNSKVDYTPLINKIGHYIQVRDDYQNLTSKDYTDNKGYCEDISEGKFSFLIIHSITSKPSDTQLLNILRKRTKDVELKKFALTLLQNTDTFNYCLQFLETLEKEIRAEISRLGGNPLLEKIIDRLSVKKEDFYLD